MSPKARLSRAAIRLAVALVVIGAVGGPVGYVTSPTAAVAAPGRGTTPTPTTTPTKTTPSGGDNSGGGGSCGGFQSFCTKVNGLKGPGTAIVGALCGVGLIVGAAMLGIGQQSGMRIMALSAAAGAGILIGNGVVSVFT
jgi:hypothetical protein